MIDRDSNMKEFMNENFPDIENEKPSKNWSLEEIDKLLSDDAENNNVILNNQSEPETDENLYSQSDIDSKLEKFDVDDYGSKYENAEKYLAEEKTEDTKTDYEKLIDKKLKEMQDLESEEEFSDTVQQIPDFEVQEEPKISFAKKIKLFFNKNSKNSDFIESRAEINEDFVEESGKTEISEDEPSVMVSFASKTVGLPVIKNENIDHQILDEEINRDNDVENKNYRERFMNVPKQNLLNTEEFERQNLEKSDEVYERPGIIIKKSKFTNTADLEPLPTIIAADQASSNIQMQAEPHVEGQMKIEGFDNEEKIEHLDEEKEELNLKEKRLEKIKKFKLDAEIGKEEDTDQEEEQTINLSADNDDTEAILKKHMVGDKIAVIFTAFFFVFSVVSTSIVSFTLENVLIHLIVNLTLLLMSAVLSYKVVSAGIMGLVSKRPNLATLINFLTILNLVQIAVLCFNYENAITAYPIYASENIFMFLVMNFANYFVDKRVYGNFKFLNSGLGLYASTVLRNPDDAFELGRGLLIGEPAIYYSSKIKNLSSFLKNSYGLNPLDNITKKLVPIIAGLSLIDFVASSVVFKSALSGLIALNAFLVISVPAFSALLFCLPLFIENKKLNHNGAMIAGHSSIEKAITANAVCLDANDLFRAESCSIVGIKLFNNMRIDDAILYAAAMVIKSNGPLKGVFDSVILGKHELLPPVEGLAYEDRLGLSAWIHRRRVLFGSPELLKNHSVEIPSNINEKMYLQKGRKIIYLAIAGKVAAMFVVTYSKSPDVEKQLHKIEQTGVPILVSSCDFNINEQLICQKFRLQSSSIKVLNSVSGEIFNKHRETEKDDCDSGIVHNGTLENFATTFYNAVMLHDIDALSKQITLVYFAIACILFVVLSVLQSSPMIVSLEILLFQFLWTGVSIVMTMFKTMKK